jgi:hypothetical protein
VEETNTSLKGHIPLADNGKIILNASCPLERFYSIWERITQVQYPQDISSMHYNPEWFDERVWCKDEDKYGDMQVCFFSELKNSVEPKCAQMMSSTWSDNNNVRKHDDADVKRYHTINAEHWCQQCPTTWAPDVASWTLCAKIAPVYIWCYTIGNWMEAGNTQATIDFLHGSRLKFRQMRIGRLINSNDIACFSKLLNLPTN